MTHVVMKVSSPPQQLFSWQVRKPKQGPKSKMVMHSINKYMQLSVMIWCNYQLWFDYFNCMRLAIITCHYFTDLTNPQPHFLTFVLYLTHTSMWQEVVLRLFTWCISNFKITVIWAVIVQSIQQRVSQRLHLPPLRPPIH